MTLTEQSTALEPVSLSLLNRDEEEDDDDDSGNDGLGGYKMSIVTS